MSSRRRLHLTAIAVLLIVATALLLGGCSDPKPMTLGEGNSGQTIGLARGQRLIVELPANATTGFSWAVAKAGGLTQVGEPEYAPPSASGAVGAGGIATFTFEASTPGTGRLTLEYRKPWGKDVAAEKTWSVTLSVK